VAFPKHFRFVMRGDFKGSPESWSTSCHFNRQVSGSPDAGLGDIDEDAVSNAVITFLGSYNLPNKVECTDWRMYEIGTNGKMESNGPLLHTFEPGEAKGSNSGIQFPPQLAVCVTLVATQRGPAQFGRMFLPSGNFTPDADWRQSVGACDAYAAATTALLKSIADAIDLPLNPGSASAVNVSDRPIGSAGTGQVIDHVEVGRAYDTIRNRRKSIPEDRQVYGHIDW
jgi:hypothetical protein